MILEDLIECLASRGESTRVAEVCVGLGYTYVQLDDGRIGVSYTLLERDKAHCTMLARAGRYTQGDSLETAGLIFSTDPLERSLGLAAINALAKPRGEIEGDILRLLALNEEDAVGMVGYFGPLIPPIQSRARSLIVFERNPSMLQHGSFVRPEKNADFVLPECDVVILSATTLLTGAFDRLMDLIHKARAVVLLGASCPLFPEVFAQTPVTILSGIRVIDPEGLKKSVREAGGTPSFRGSTVKVNLSIQERSVCHEG